MREFCSEKVCFAVSWSHLVSQLSHARIPVFQISVCLPTANFKRPIVIMGPLNDIAMEKLAREMPDQYEAAGRCLLLKLHLHYFWFEFFFCYLPFHFDMMQHYPLFFNADMVPRSGADSSSTVIKLDTVRKIAEKVNKSNIFVTCNQVI